jgi:site-specific recombinase XerD
MLQPLPIQNDRDLISADNGQRLDEHPAVVYLAGLSAGSRRTMAGALNAIARIVTNDETADYFDVPWQQLRFQHTVAIRSQLATDYKHSTANRMLSALRGTLKAAWRLGLMSAEDYQLAASVESVSGETVPAGRHIPSGELVALLATCTQDKLGIRDAAVISLLYGLGLRRAEVVTLNLSDYEETEGQLVVRGKGNKERLVPVAGGTAEALADWLTVRGRKPGPLFVGVGTRNKGGGLTTQAIYNMLRTRVEAAQITAVSPHDFRRTFVGELLDAGADIVTVQKLANSRARTHLGLTPNNISTRSAWPTRPPCSAAKPKRSSAGSRPP